METQDKDVMANIAMVVGILIILAVVIFMVTSLLSTIDKNSIKGGDADAEAKTALVNERLKPIGSVTSAAANAAPVVRSGKEIVDATCISCHGTGVLGAPKVGDAAAWTPRFAQGMPTLMSHATEGFNAMPARGGDGALSDADVKKAIVQMLKDSGQTVSEDAAPAAEAAPVADAAPAAVEAAPAPVAEAPAPVMEAVAEESDTAIGSVSGGSALVDSSGQAVASAGATASVATEAAPAASGIDPNTRGKEIYKMACFSCHDMGIAGAPKLGDSAAWAPRIATGFDSLYNTAINGRGAMPPKGGRVDMSDDEIKATVQFMVGMAQ